MIEFKKYTHFCQEIEQAVLGQCFLEKLAMGRTYGIIEPDHFYFDCHKKVYSALKEMYDNSIPIDIYTTTEYLARQGVAELQGDDIQYFICRLTNWVVGTGHLEYHCYLIKEFWQRREIIKIKYSYSDELDPRKQAAEINSEINKLIGSEFKRDWYDMTELMFDLMKHQVEISKGDKTFITTGFKKADELNGGFYNGQLIVIGARPSVGKSSIMGKMALSIAKTGKKVGIISLEMNNTEIAARLSSLETEIDFGTIFKHIANDENLHRKFYDIISKQTINLPIYLSDKTKVNIHEIKAKAIKLKATKGCDCIMIDYLQLIDSSQDNRNYNREQEVAKMSRGLKLMAQELNIPVIVLCQLNRQSTSRSFKDRFPRLSDLRESGSIEQDADIVMFVHRDWMSGYEVDDNGNSTERTADLLAAKWRNGATFHLSLDFDPPKMKFSEKPGFKPIVNAPENFQNDNPF